MLNRFSLLCGVLLLAKHAQGFNVLSKSVCRNRWSVANAGSSSDNDEVKGSTDDEDPFKAIRDSMLKLDNFLADGLSFLGMKSKSPVEVTPQQVEIESSPIVSDTQSDTQSNVTSTKGIGVNSTSSIDTAPVSNATVELESKLEDLPVVSESNSTSASTNVTKESVNLPSNTSATSNITEASVPLAASSAVGDKTGAAPPAPKPSLPLKLSSMKDKAKVAATASTIASPIAPPAPPVVAPSYDRKQLQQTVADDIFNNFQQQKIDEYKEKKMVTKVVINPIRAKLLSASEVEQAEASLIELLKKTKRGIKFTDDEKAEAEGLFESLECTSNFNNGPRTLLKDIRIDGNWEVMWSSTPTSAGGPFRGKFVRRLSRLRSQRQDIDYFTAGVLNDVRILILGFVPVRVQLLGKFAPTGDRAEPNQLRVNFDRPRVRVCGIIPPPLGFLRRLGKVGRKGIGRIGKGKGRKGNGEDEREGEGDGGDKGDGEGGGDAREVMDARGESVRLNGKQWRPMNGFQIGPKSEVIFSLTYISDRIRLARGQRGTMFVFEKVKERTAEDWKGGWEPAR